MLPSDITLGDVTYALQTQRPTSSVRADSGRELEKPVTLSIAHETGKNGRVSSVVIFDSSEVISCDDTCAINPTTDNIRVHLKIQYNPLSGRTGIDIELKRLLAELQVFMVSTDLMDRFENKES